MVISAPCSSSYLECSPRVGVALTPYASGRGELCAGAVPTTQANFELAELREVSRGGVELATCVAAFGRRGARVCSVRVIVDRTVRGDLRLAPRQRCSCGRVDGSQQDRRERAACFARQPAAASVNTLGLRRAVRVSRSDKPAADCSAGGAVRIELCKVWNGPTTSTLQLGLLDGHACTPGLGEDALQLGVQNVRPSCTQLQAA